MGAESACWPPDIQGEGEDEKSRGHAATKQPLTDLRTSRKVVDEDTVTRGHTEQSTFTRKGHRFGIRFQLKLGLNPR